MDISASDLLSLCSKAYMCNRFYEFTLATRFKKERQNQFKLFFKLKCNKGTKYMCMPPTKFILNQLMLHNTDSVESDRKDFLIPEINEKEKKRVNY